MPFGHAHARLSIASLDEANLTVTAHYNPAELAIKKAMTWSAKAEQTKPTLASRSEQDSHEFKGSPTRTMNVELLFDGYETGKSVEPIVDILETLSNPRDPDSTIEEMRRPHYCVLVFGDGIKPLRCILTGLNVRYTMFAGDGTPLRAVCSVELQEAQLRSSFGGVKTAATGAAKPVARSLFG